jgi:hypothetical protein
MQERKHPPLMADAMTDCTFEQELVVAQEELAFVGHPIVEG